MVIRTNPRISGGFVHHVMRNPVVSDLIKDMSEEDAHNLVKSVIIAAMKDFDIDVNNIINRVREEGTVPKKSLLRETPEIPDQGD